MQTMVLQTAVALPVAVAMPVAVPARSISAPTQASDTTSATLGWVVPLPSVPEFIELTPNHAEHLFYKLDAMTRPSVTHISEWLLLALAFLLLCALVGGVVVLIVRGLRGGFSSPVHKSRTVTIAMFGFVGLLLFAVILPALGTAGGGGGVEVITSEQIGVFDASVVKATSSNDLVSWLNEHGFTFTEGDRPVLDEAIAAGWCFAVAIVRDDMRDRFESGTGARLIDPLVMRFAAAEPTYPLALTGTIGSDTEILIYLLTDVKRDSRQRLPLRAAHTITGESIERLLHESLPMTTNPSMWLCKFKGTLTPAEMKTDLVFAPSADLAPSREHLVRW